MTEAKLPNHLPRSADTYANSFNLGKKHKNNESQEQERISVSSTPNSDCLWRGNLMLKGKSLSEVLIFPSTNPQYDDIHENSKFKPGENMFCKKKRF